MQPLPLPVLDLVSLGDSRVLGQFSSKDPDDPFTVFVGDARLVDRGSVGGVIWES